MSDGLRQSASISQTFAYDDNPLFLPEGSEGGFESITSLDYELTSRTRSQEFSFGVGFQVLVDENGDGADLRGPLIRLGYLLDNRQNRVGARLSYRNEDLGDVLTQVQREDPDFENILIVEDEIVDAGERETINGSLSFESGLNAPFGFGATLRVNEVSYDDLPAGSTLADRSEWGLGLRSTLRFSPTFSSDVTLDYSQADTEDTDKTFRESGAFGVSFTARPSDATELTAGVSYVQNRVETTADTTETDGVALRFEVNRAVSNRYQIGLLAARNITTNGTRDRFEITQSLGLQRGDLSFGVGYVRPENQDPQPLVNFNYTHELRLGEIEIALSQAAGIDTDDRDLIRTNARVRYGQALTSQIGLGMSLDLARTDVLSDANDVTRVNAGLEMRYEMRDDWSLVSGVSHSLLRQDNEDDTRASRFSITLRKDFQR